MLKNFFHILLITFSFQIFADNHVTEVLKKAEQAYKQKNYSLSIQLYNELIHQNYYSAELYYNLGNAYFKNNQLGKAILYYEKAKKIKPSDDDINYNLPLAYSKTIDKIETRDNFFIEITKNNFLNQLNSDTLAYLSITLSVIALVFFAVFLFYRHHKKFFLSVSVGLITTTIILYILGYAANQSHQNNQFAIVTQKEIKATNEPLPNAVLKFKLHEGTKVKIIQKVDTFYLIRLENAVEGWIDEKSVEII